MQNKKSDYNEIKGIIDVGIIVVSHFKNPIMRDMIDFLKPILNWEKKVIIPNTTFLGAFHILTSYLRVSKVDAKKVLLNTFSIESPCFINDVSKNVISEALEQAVGYNVESWDGYLVSLGKVFNTDIIYTVDMQLKKVKEMHIINPNSEEKMKEYHNWLVEKMKKKKRLN